MTATGGAHGLQDAIWEGSLPIEIRLSASECHPEVIPYDGWFSFEDVPLKWQYPLGLLYDLFSGASPFQASGPKEHSASPTEDAEDGLPWRLTLHFTEWPEQALVRPDAEGKMHHDAYINSVKEADFLRNGTAKGIMSLSKEDSTQLWNAVQTRMTPIL
ncbi:Autophagy protein 5 [Lecanora helva]